MCLYWTLTRVDNEIAFDQKCRCYSDNQFVCSVSFQLKDGESESSYIHIGLIRGAAMLKMGVVSHSADMGLLLSLH